MTTKSQRVLKFSLNDAMARRRQLLIRISWLSVMLWPALSYVGYRTRPLELYTIVGLGMISALSVVVVLMLALGRAENFSRDARLFNGVYMTATVAQTANVLFGSTGPLYLNGQPPLIIAGYQIISVLAYVTLDNRSALRMTRVYASALALLIVGHALTHWSQFTSFYALAMTFTMGCLLLPGTQLLMRLYLDLHLEALSEAQLREAKQRSELELSHRRSVTDPATGLLNEQGMMERIGALMSQAQDFGVIAFRLDAENTVREVLGKNDYDKLLSEASELLAQEAGNKDQMARRNGSELLVWTLEINHSAQLEQTAQKLLEQLHALPSTKRQSKVPIRFHAAGSTSQGHLDISFLLEEVNFRLFLARLRDSRTCFDA